MKHHSKHWDSLNLCRNAHPKSQLLGANSPRSPRD